MTKWRCNIVFQSQSRFRSSGSGKTRINHFIRAPKIRLIDDEGNQVGVVETRVGIQKAIEKELDLVEVSPSSDPPVCRIMDYGKYKFDQEKKKKMSKKKQHVVQIKEIRFKMGIGEHDYNFKIKHIKEFLDKKDKVRVSLKLRGRELAHKELGMELMNRIAKDISPFGEIDSAPKWLGRDIMMTVIPKR